MYIDANAIGRGIGRLLLTDLIDAARPWNTGMVAVIGDSATTRSNGLHRVLGFPPCRALVSVGRKCDRYLDVVFMQHALLDPVP